MRVRLHCGRSPRLFVLPAGGSVGRRQTGHQAEIDPCRPARSARLPGAALVAHVAILDERGTIAVNPSWRRLEPANQDRYRRRGDGSRADLLGCAPGRPCCLAASLHWRYTSGGGRLLPLIPPGAAGTSGAGRGDQGVVADSLARILLAREQVTAAAFELRGSDRGSTHAHREDGQGLARSLTGHHTVAWACLRQSAKHAPKRSLDLQGPAYRRPASVVRAVRGDGSAVRPTVPRGPVLTRSLAVQERRRCKGVTG